MQLHKQQRRRSVRTKLKDSFRMLDYASDCDLFEIDRVHSQILTSSGQLSFLENKYNIKNYTDSRNLYRYPCNIRSIVAKLWSEIDSGANDLDYLFIDEDLYPLPYF